MALAANKLPGVRAVTANSAFLAEMARRHNDANVLCLGARVLEASEAQAVLRAWCASAYEAGRHQLRLDMISRAEERWRETGRPAGVEI
jgi:ribose 5-phosphate isomerase B